MSISFLKNISLLYAEDEKIAQALYTGYFEQFFNTVYVANDGQQALAIYKEKQPDIIVLDIEMPKLNGLDVCKVIRENDKKTKIILLTARDDKEALLEAIELGLTTYLEKPVKKEKLDQVLVKLSEQLCQANKILLWSDDEQEFYWDLERRELFCNSQLVSLTKKQKLLFELLLTTHNEKLNYHQIHDYVWSDDHDSQHFSERSIITLIQKLREKLPPDVIKNAYGLGYYLKK